MALPVITAFAASPDRGRGLARDMRVRWALEEVGQRYDVRLVPFDETCCRRIRTWVPTSPAAKRVRPTSGGFSRRASPRVDFTRVPCDAGRAKLAQCPASKLPSLPPPRWR